MLVIDESMLKLSKMQETLLKVSDKTNIQSNLNKYINTVMEIDKQAFSGLFDELSQLNEHNRTLEEELQFLEQVKSYYDQLYELQMSFKNVCEMYDNNDLKLSDMSRVDIEYIENRISTINGYLINKKNIVENKKKLQQLNDDLVVEEKNSRVLSERLSSFERDLVDNFINAEGRIIEDGKLQYLSVISEYKNLDYDFELLLRDKLAIDRELTKLNNEKTEVEEKVKVAEICFERSPNSESKQIYNEIKKEYFKIKYRLSLLKILHLLNQECTTYDLFKEKREKILDLIKYRKDCLEKLGVHVSIDPFDRTRVSEQLDMISSLKDNYKSLNKIRKLIAELSERIEEMETQNDRYMLEIKNTKELIIDKMSMSDIDVSSVIIDIDDYVANKKVEDNQVVSVKDINNGFNMSIINQKTSGVIKRVNEMMNVISNPVQDELVVPDLVIVPDINNDDEEENVNSSMLEENIGFVLPIEDIGTDEESKEEKEEQIQNNEVDVSVEFPNEIKLENTSDNGEEEILDFVSLPAIEVDDKEEKDKLDVSSDDIFDDVLFVSPFVDENVKSGENEFENFDNIGEKTGSESIGSSLFETTKPFDDVPLFTERTDSEINEDDKLFFDRINANPVLDNAFEEKSIDLVSNSNDEVLGEDMPDAFWITQEEKADVIEDNVVPSFDEQINALLESEDNLKIKKLVA